MSYQEIKPVDVVVCWLLLMRLLFCHAGSIVVGDGQQGSAQLVIDLCACLSLLHRCLRDRSQTFDRRQIVSVRLESGRGHRGKRMNC